MEWNGSWDQQCIAAKELLPIVLACAIWGTQWQHHQVLVWCDNTAVVSIMASQTSKDSLIMHLLKCMHFFWALHDILVWAEHIPGASNTVADAISHNNLQVMFQEVPGVSKVPDPIHPALRQLQVDQLAVRQLESLITNSLAASSRKAYGSGQVSYHQFCRKLNLARTASSSSWLSCRSGCHTQPPGCTSQRSGTYIFQRGAETHWPTPHVLTWY